MIPAASRLLADDGRRRLEAGDAAAAAGALTAALGIWRGEVLADFPDAAFARDERARLERARLAALEDRITADLTLGRYKAALADLDRLVAAHPYRESLHGLRMLALYRTGRQVEALATFQEVRQRLRDDLGVDPDPHLEGLHRQILGHAPHGAAVRGHEGAAPPHRGVGVLMGRLAFLVGAPLAWAVLLARRQWEPGSSVRPAPSDKSTV